MNLKSDSGPPLEFVCLSHCDITCQGELLGTFNQSQLKMIAKISTASLVRIIKLLLDIYLMVLVDFFSVIGKGREAIISCAEDVLC